MGNKSHEAQSLVNFRAARHNGTAADLLALLLAAGLAADTSIQCVKGGLLFTVGTRSVAVYRALGRQLQQAGFHYRNNYTRQIFVRVAF
jgi:hypothetical protein